MPWTTSTAVNSGERGGRIAVPVLAALALIFCLQASRTHRVFNDTADEEPHIACGLQVWQHGRYAVEYQHPPLARVILAGPAYWAGLRHRQGLTVTWTADRESYWQTLIWARRANLLFLPLLLIPVYLWGRDLHGPRAGLAAAVLVSFSPNLLAHGALATLDFGAAATQFLALYCFWRWSRQPGWRWCLASAVAFGLAALTKFSALFFLPPAVVLFWVAARRGSPRWLQAAGRGAAFGVSALLVIWAGYFFEAGPWKPPQIFPPSASYQAYLEHALQAVLYHRSIPAPGFPRGVLDVLAHNAGGHTSYLLGQERRTGWWYYFPVAVGVKTTLPLLLLAALGLALRARANFAPLLAALAVAGICILGNLNLGIRHILVLYPLLALMASALFCGPRRWVAVAAALTLWHAAESLAAHPDYLAYFNQVARGREEHFLLDSNLDWGQDQERLRQFLDRNGIDKIHLFCFGRTDAARLGIRGIVERVDGPRLSGWVAVSHNNLAGLTRPHRDLDWLKRYTPAARIGKSILVYHFPQEVEHGFRPGRISH